MPESYKLSSMCLSVLLIGTPVNDFHHNITNLSLYLLSISISSTLGVHRFLRMLYCMSSDRLLLCC